MTGIVMDVNTGAILGMATKGDFDPNDPFTITDETKLQELQAITDEEEYKEKRTEILQDQWRNKAITDTYDPGSTFKILTAAMALEEKAVSFVAGYKPIRCWKYPQRPYQNLYKSHTEFLQPRFY